MPSLLDVSRLRDVRVIRRGPVRARAVVTVLLGGAMMLGCSESTPIDGTARRTAVVEQIVRELAVPPPEPDDLPVVFVVGAERTISIEVQAGVAAALVDEVDVRFADERVEAIDESIDELPVREGGVLLVVDEVPPDGRLIDVEVERYVADDDRERVVVSLRWRDPEWSVTSTTIVPPAVPD